MLNAVQFSSAKSSTVAGLLQSAVFDENKAVKSYSQFNKEANEITDIVNGTWLRVERDTGVKQAANAELFNRMRDDADLYPYWEYLETSSDHPREEHLALVGLVFRIGDPDGDDCHPQNGWNCGCGSSTLDDQELQERGLRVLSNEEANDYLMKDVDPQFRFNSANQGIMPKEGHSYFQSQPDANAVNYKTFGLPGAKDMPDHLSADINNRITEIKKQAADLVDPEEVRKTNEHKEEIASILKTNKELESLIIKHRLSRDAEAYAKVAAEYNSNVYRMQDLYKKIRSYKADYAERAAELLKSGTAADLKVIGSRSENIVRGSNIFKKIIGNKTNLEGSSLKAKIIKNRANYSITKDVMNVKADDPLETVAHEMAHWLETKDKAFFSKVQDFYESRTAGEKTVRLRTLFPKYNYGADEVVKEDKFMNPYTGKLYLNKKFIDTFDKKSQYATEITSMWFTHALSDLKGFIEKDPDHFEFIFKLFNK